MMATTATRVTLRRLSTTPLFAKHSRRVTVAPLSTSASSSSDRVSPEAPSKISWDSKQPIALRMRDREPENMQPFCIQVQWISDIRLLQVNINVVLKQIADEELSLNVDVKKLA